MVGTQLRYLSVLELALLLKLHNIVYYRVVSCVQECMHPIAYRIVYRKWDTIVA